MSNAATGLRWLALLLLWGGVYWNLERAAEWVTCSLAGLDPGLDQVQDPRQNQTVNDVSTQFNVFDGQRPGLSHGNHLGWWEDWLRTTSC